MTTTDTTISSIRQTDAGHWTWTVTAMGWDGEMSTATWRTDRYGSGLWVRDDRRGEWKQILGHTQFSLNCAPSTRRRRVVEYFNNEF